MPIYDALEHLIAISGLNMLLYFLERAKRVAGDDDPVEIVCEIVSKERTKVRALSGEQLPAQPRLALQGGACTCRVDPYGRRLGQGRFWRLPRR